MNNDTDIPSVEYLGITEAAEYLRVSASTLRRWEKKGFLVPERTPTGIRRYTKRQLDDVIQAPEDVAYAHSATEHHSDLIDTENQVQPSMTEIPLPASANEVEITTHDEVAQLRDFFHKAGYDTVDDSPIQLAATPPMNQPATQEHLQHAATESTFHSMRSTHTPSVPETPPQDEFTLLSLYDITKETSPTQSVPEHPHQQTQWQPPQEVIHSTVEPLSQAVQPKRIEVFHEEHSVASQESLSSSFEEATHFETPETTQSSQEGEHQEITYRAATKVNSSRNYTVYVIIFVAIVVLCFVGWAIYSYAISPQELYNPVLE